MDADVDRGTVKGPEYDRSVYRPRRRNSVGSYEQGYENEFENETARHNKAPMANSKRLERPQSKRRSSTTIPMYHNKVDDDEVILSHKNVLRTRSQPRSRSRSSSRPHSESRPHLESRQRSDSRVPPTSVPRSNEEDC